MLSKFLIELIPIGKIKHNLLDKYFFENEKIKISKDTKCLVVAPHPDDETIGCGGIMLKYSKNFDCIVMSSAGVAEKNFSAEKMADIRISEFYKVMNFIGIKNRWVFKTFGIPPLNKQIKKLKKDYLKVLNMKKYDYIFVPHPNDRHPEHRYISRYILKYLLKHQKYKKSLKICFYDIWTLLKQRNHHEDISEVAKKKYKALQLYKSQNTLVSYPDMADGLSKVYAAYNQKGLKYAEAFYVISVNKYLLGKK